MTAEEAAYQRGSTPESLSPRSDQVPRSLRSAPAEVPTRVASGDDGVLVLIADLCRALEARGIRYCHFKSNESIERSLSGENDLDLLVARADATAFEAALRELAFREVRQPAWKRLPGIYHAYGVDPTGAFVHIHTHHQLVVGDDMTKNVHLPIESAYVASSRSEGWFPIPAPAYELSLFLIRMTVKHCTWDSIVSLQGSLATSERRELEDLRRAADLDDVVEVGRAHLPFIPEELWGRCLRAIEPGASLWFRVRTADRLQRALAGCSRRPPAADTWPGCGDGGGP